MESEEVVRYYTETGLDYATWSEEFNMHFGYWRWPLNPFHREPMLDVMNQEVLSALRLDDRPQTVLDLGCGLGATMRAAARRFDQVDVRGFTLVPWQVHQAGQLNAPFGSRLRVSQANYLDLPLPAGYADAAYALESCCHAPALDKAGFLQELHRVLKPGARFAIADGFTTSEPRARPALFSRLLETSRRGWALPAFPDREAFLTRLEQLGFEDLEVTDLSWRIAPSVLHAPLLVARFILTKALEGEKLNAVRWNHLRACLVSLGVGAFRSHFSYLLVTGRKP